MDITISLITTLVLTLINGYFSMSEMALTTAKRAVLEHEAEEGDKRAERAIKLAADSDQLLATIQVAITLVGFASSAVASTSLSDPLATWLMSFGIAPLSAIARGLAPVIITVAVAFVSIVIGELVPKRIGLANAEGVSKQVVGPLSFFQKIARPLVWLTGACSDGLARILRIKSADDRQNVSEEEIKYMVSEQDDLLDEEKRMIHEIFDLGDTVAREVMVPRVDTTMCEDDETVADVLSTMRQTGFSRIPVYHEDPDNVAGIAHIKDLIQPALDGKGDQPIAGFLRDATFVPDTKDIRPRTTRSWWSWTSTAARPALSPSRTSSRRSSARSRTSSTPTTSISRAFRAASGSSMGVFRAMTRLSLVGRSRKAMIMRPSPAGFWSFVTRCPTSERCLRSRGTSSRCSRCVASASRSFA